MSPRGADPVAPVRRPATVRFSAPLLAAVAVLVVFGVRQQAVVDRYAVDVMYWDTWDLYRPLFAGQGWWATFDQQHGPHRQGLGGWVLRAVAISGRWDTRNDAAAVGWVLIAAAATAVALAWRCGVRGWTLAVVPAIVLNLRQYQMLVAASNPAHGALPLLLLLGWGLAGFARRTGVRLSLVVGLTAVATFTGFGVFLGVLTPAVLAVEMATAARRRRPAWPAGVALLATAAAWAAFGFNYRRDTAAGAVRWADHWADYPRFVGVMVANAVGVPGASWAAVAVGLGVVGAAAAVCVARGRRAGAGDDPADLAIAGLAAFGLLFAVDAAAGRAFVGWTTGASSRYVTLCTPLTLAVVLHLATTPAARRWAAVVATALVVGTLALRPADLALAQWAHDGCLAWRSAYLSTGDQAAADRLARFPIYERPNALADRLAILRRDRLNLFDSAAFGPEVPTGPAADR